MSPPPTPPPNPYSRQNLNYAAPSSMNLVDQNGNLSQEHQFTHRNRYSEVQFTPLHHQFPAKIDDSGSISPPLWKNNPSPPRSPSHPLLGHQNLSPDSRAQAIARGRSELMEMVRHMPESSYELSLKDIVEHHHRPENQVLKRGAVGLKKEESMRFERKTSFESKGMFLNMTLPFSFKSKKKKKIVGNNSGRVSPKPDGLKGGGGERDWWKKKFTGSSDSDSSKASVNSGSSGATTTTTTSSSGRSRSDSRGRRKNGLIRGCWHFFHFRRSKSVQ